MSGFCRPGKGLFGTMRPSMTLREKIEERIARQRGDDVVLAREFADLGGPDQVLRALRRLTREGRVVRLGCGVYGRAMTSSISGKPIVNSSNGFIGPSRQGLRKLGIAWEPVYDGRILFSACVETL